jgi:hypothetical protein
MYNVNYITTYTITKDLKMARITTSETTTVVNEHGEVKEESKTRVINFGTEDSYIKLYIKDICYLEGLQGKVSEVMFELCKYVSYGNIVLLPTGILNKIAKDLGMKKQTLKNYIQDLKRQKVLIAKDIGYFILNPYLFGKGEWKDIVNLRNENLELKIIYDRKTNKRRIKAHKSDKVDSNEMVAA